MVKYSFLCMRSINLSQHANVVSLSFYGHFTRLIDARGLNLPQSTAAGCHVFLSFTASLHLLHGVFARVFSVHILTLTSLERLLLMCKVSYAVFFLL